MQDNFSRKLYCKCFTDIEMIKRNYFCVEAVLGEGNKHAWGCWPVSLCRSDRIQSVPYFIEM